MPRGFVLDAKAIQKLRDDHEQLRRTVHRLEQKITSTAGYGIRPSVAYAKVTEQLRPFKGATNAAGTGLIGSGKAKLLAIDSKATSVYFRKYTELEEVDVFNTSRVPVPVGATIMVTRDFRSGLWMAGDVETAIAKVGLSAIPARSGATAGSGLVDILNLDESNGNMSVSSETLTVYNLSATAVTASAYITIKRISMDDSWIVDAEDCG